MAAATAPTCPTAPTSVRPGALAGRTLLLADPAGDPLPGSGLAAALAGLGARLVADRGRGAGYPGWLDLLVVDLRGAVNQRGGPSAAAVPDRLAGPVTGAFQCAGERRPALARARGGMLFLLPGGGDPANQAIVAAVRSLAGTLAHEWAPDGVRANCLLLAAADPVSDRLLAEWIAYLASPAAAMLTGQLLELRGPEVA